MFINKKEKFSIRKFKDGRSDSVKIGTVGLIVGAALAMAGQPHIAEAAMTENSDNTTTISNDKGSVIVDTANIENPDAGRAFSTDPTAEGTNTITKTGKVDYKYVTAEGNTVLEENKNQNSGADKTIETTYDVYGKSGEVFKETTGGDAEDSDLNDAKENGKKATIEKDGKTYHLIGEPKVENTGNGGGVYSDTTLGDVTAKLTPEGLSNAEGKITYDTVKAGGKAWIVEQTGKGTYGKYVLADSGAITSDAKMVEAFKAGEAAAKDFTSTNVTADGGIKEGDYVFVLEKNTYVTAKTESFALTASIQLTSSDNGFETDANLRCKPSITIGIYDMKTLLIAVAAASLMLGACSSSKTTEEAKTPSVSVEEVIAQCQQASGANQDRAVFDACMKDKGYQRSAAEGAAAAAASAPAAQ